MEDSQLKLNLQQIATKLNSFVGITQEVLNAEQTETLDILNDVDGIQTEMETYDSPNEVESILDDILGENE